MTAARPPLGDEFEIWRGMAVVVRGAVAMRAKGDDFAFSQSTLLATRQYVNRTPRFHVSLPTFVRKLYHPRIHSPSVVAHRCLKYGVINYSTDSAPRWDGLNTREFVVLPHSTPVPSCRKVTRLWLAQCSLNARPTQQELDHGQHAR